jgi:hypothetical protein
MTSEGISHKQNSRHGNVVKSKLPCRRSASSSTCGAQNLDKSYKLVELCHTMEAGLMVAHPSPFARPSTKHRWPQRPTILSFVCIARGYLVYRWSGPLYHTITIVTESLGNRHGASDIGEEYGGESTAEEPSVVDTTSQRCLSKVVDPNLL